MPDREQVSADSASPPLFCPYQYQVGRSWFLLLVPECFCLSDPLSPPSTSPLDPLPSSEQPPSWKVQVVHGNTSYRCLFLLLLHWGICKRENPSIFPASAAKLLQLCPTLCDPIDGSPPGSAIPGILQARTLEWVAISFSNA